MRSATVVSSVGRLRFWKACSFVFVRIISDVRVVWHGGKLEWWLGDHSPGPSHEPIVDKYTRLIIAKNVSAPVVVNIKGAKQAINPSLKKGLMVWSSGSARSLWKNSARRKRNCGTMGIWTLEWLLGDHVPQSAWAYALLISVRICLSSGHYKENKQQLRLA